MRTRRRAAALLSALALAGVLTSCADDGAQDVPITNDPGETPQDGDPVAPGPEVTATP